MTYLIMNDYVLDTLASEYAKEIFSKTFDWNEKDMGDAYDLAHEYADRSEWIRHTDKAHMLCQNCETDYGEEVFYECWGGDHMTYDQMAKKIAYGELNSRINGALFKLRYA